MKNPSENAGETTDMGSIPAWGIATDSSILVQIISWTEEPSGLKSIGLQRARHA